MMSASEDRVLAADHAEIAMARLGGVNELCGRAGRGERRRDFARHMTALADPGDDQAAADRRTHVQRAPEHPVEGSRQLLKPIDLGPNDPPRNRDVLAQPRRPRDGGKGRQPITRHDRDRLFPQNPLLPPPRPRVP
jgi:hypothetical protein